VCWRPGIVLKSVCLARRVQQPLLAAALHLSAVKHRVFPLPGFQPEGQICRARASLAQDIEHEMLGKTGKLIDFVE
jgi:hypothetical protein